MQQGNIRTPHGGINSGDSTGAAASWLGLEAAGQPHEGVGHFGLLWAVLDGPIFDAARPERRHERNDGDDCILLSLRCPSRNRRCPNPCFRSLLHNAATPCEGKSAMAHSTGGLHLVT